jgi:hypothetical protein
LKATPGSITHLSVSLALASSPDTLKIISIDGEKVNFESLKSTGYRLRKEISLVHAIDNTNPLVDGFIEYLFDNRKEIFAKAKFLID